MPIKHPTSTRPTLAHWRLWAASVLALAVLPGHAAWSVNSETAAFHFVTTKNVNVSEVQSFKKVKGQLSDAGKLEFNVDLKSLSTQIEIRDQRMLDLLFEVAKFPAEAVFTAQVDPSVMKQVLAKKSLSTEIKGSLSLHGKTQPVSAKLQLLSLDGKSLIATTREPILVKANDFALEGGIEKLRELVGLPSIGAVVPVNFWIELKAK